MKTKKARLDADGTAKPLTRLIKHVPAGAVPGPGRTSRPSNTKTRADPGRPSCPR